MVNPSPSTTVTYQWNTTECYTNPNFNNGNPRCFPNGLTTERVTGIDLTAEDAGVITCTATIDDGTAYVSGPFTLRVSGEQVSFLVIKVISSHFLCCNFTTQIL